MTRCLKVLREAACLQLAERLFQSFTPLNEKHFLPFSVPFFGNLRSVDVLRSLYDVLCEFFLNLNIIVQTVASRLFLYGTRSINYFGAKLRNDIPTFIKM